MPIDEIALNKAIEQASRADALLRNELLTGALRELEDTYIAAWRSTLARDADARERLWQAVQVVGKVRDHLAHVVSGGRVAQAQLDELTAKAEREKDKDEWNKPLVQ